MASTKIGFIGLGLIGGSVAKALRKYYPDYEIIAFDKNRETLALAVQDGDLHKQPSHHFLFRRLSLAHPLRRRKGKKGR